MVLSNIAIRATPGATQACNQILVIGFSAAQQDFDVFRERFAAVADQTESANWQGQVYLLGGGRATTCVSVRATFDAGANANSLRVGIHGVVIPRANVGPF